MNVNRLRVAVFWDSFKQSHGIQTFIFNITKGLHKNSIDMYIFDLSKSRNTFTFLDPLLQGRIISMPPSFFEPPIAYHQRILRTLQKLSPHIVVFNNEFAANYLTSLGEKIPTLDIIHSDWPESFRWREMGPTLRRFSCIVAVSNRIAEKAEEQINTQRKVVSIPSGVELEEVSHDSPITGTTRVLYVGRLEQRAKRIHDLVCFADTLRHEVKNSELVVIGEGSERSFLEKSLNHHNGRVIFTGHLDLYAVKKEYRRAHFFVQFSEFEGLSLALLEAMGHGVVPIVTAIDSGVPQVIRHKENGYLFPVGNPIAAVRALKCALPQWERLSRNAYEMVSSRFNLEAMCQAYAELFQNLAREPLSGRVLFIDQGYKKLPGKIARRILPISIYRDLLRRII